MQAQVKETQLELMSKEINKDYAISNRKWVLSLIERKLREGGADSKWAPRFSKSIARSWDSSPLPIETKKWAIRKGFKPESVYLYDLNEENYMHYLSDFDYMCLHPLNNHFAFWINDKITLKYLFGKPLCINKERGEDADLMPEYYLYIENDGHYSYLMDSPEGIRHDENYLFHLLQNKGTLALKPSNGGGGFGFVKLSYAGSQIVWNDESITEEILKQRAKELNGYIVTEFTSQHPELDEVWNKSVCTLRINIVKNIPEDYGGGEHHVIAAYARFGTEMSDGACNMHAGGVAIAFDINTGDYGDCFFRYSGFEKNTKTLYDCHPDTQVSLKGRKLPYWEQVRDSVYAVARHLSSLDYMGIDMVITDKGVKMLEINSLPAASTPQVLCGPYMDNPYAAQFFKEKKRKAMKRL